MTSNYFKPMYLIKLVAFCFLTYLFLTMFREDLFKFKNKITTTGIKIRPYTLRGKKLPCITVCALSGFRQRGFYYSNQDYIKNTFELEDFFGNKTLNEIRNSSLYRFQEVRSMFFGRCYKICSVVEMPMNGIKIWELQMDFNYKLFVHNDGDEFWLISAITHLIDLAQTVLELNRTDGIKIGIKFIDLLNGNKNFVSLFIYFFFYTTIFLTNTLKCYPLKGK